MISHSLTNVQKPCQLQSYIDNRDRTKMIGLKSITYWIGWYDITGKQCIEIKSKMIDLEPGLYNFNDLKQIFPDESVILSVNYTNGFVTLEIPPKMEIELSSGISTILGLKMDGSQLADILDTK